MLHGESRHWRGGRRGEMRREEGRGEEEERDGCDRVG